MGDFQVGGLYLSSFLDVTEYSIFAFDIFIKLFGLNREFFLVNEIQCTVKPLIQAAA